MIEINLIPAKLKKAKQMQMYVYAGVGVGIIIVGILVGIIWKKMDNISKIEKEIKRVEAESASLKDKIEEVKKFNAKEETYNKKKAVVDKLLAEQSLWPKILDRIGEIVLPDIWLSEISYSKIKKEGIVIKMKGYSPSKIVVADFLRRMEQTDNIIDLKANRIDEETVDDVAMAVFDIEFLYLTNQGGK